MNRCAPSMSLEERSLSSQSNGLVCGRTSNRSAATAGRARSNPAQGPRTNLDFMAEVVISHSTPDRDENPASVLRVKGSVLGQFLILKHEAMRGSITATTEEFRLEQPHCRRKSGQE